MTKQINEDLRRMQKLSGILLEDDAFNSGRPNNGNHDDAHWRAKEGSGQYSAGPASDIFGDPDFQPEGLLMYTDESQNTAIVVDGYNSPEQFAEDMRKLVGDRVYSAYVDEPGVFDPVSPDQLGGDVFVEVMTIKEVARLLNRWAARNGMGQSMQRFDKSDMRAKP